jgi:predicted metal-dependent hydrolase
MEAEARQRLMRDGQRAFNDGDFFAAHEHWEAVWLTALAPERRWIQGLIQVATGLHKLQGGRAEICRGLLHKALAKLEDAPAQLDGLDVGCLRADATALVGALERGEQADPHALRLGSC